MSNVTTPNLALKRSLRALLYRKHAALALLAPGIALAGPTGEDVVGGTADIIRPDANNTIINQLTNRAAINWQTFNIDADEYVIFNQPGASSIVLNRVLGGDASYILGHLQANGQVFLLNPNGVYFTHGASLDVQGFLGATLDMDPHDFMAGDFSLSQSSDASISRRVINDGVIIAGPGGYVVLAGDYTENTGVITANAGSIALVSGNALTLDIEGDGLVNFAVDQATVDAYAGVRNTGSLIADGGRVIMTAKVAHDLVATAVNNEGLVRARSVEERGGEIYLVGNGGDVANSGTLDADGENADGGKIILYGDEDIKLADGGVQTAAGDANHSGGVVRAIAEDHLDYQRDNLIRATGGTSGGFVEVSGHGSIAVRGTPLIGAGGTYLIDPTAVTIFDGTGSGNTPAGSVGTIEDAYIERQLNLGINVILAASSSVSANPGTSINATGSGDLTVGIGAIGGTTASCVGLGPSFCFGTGVTFTPSTGGNISLTNLALDIAGDLNIVAQNGTINLSNARAGNIVIDAGAGSISFNNLATTGGNVFLTGGSAGGNNIGSSGSHVGNITVNTSNNFQLSNSAHATGLFQTTATGGNVNIGGNVTAGAANFSANGFNGITVGGNINVSSSLTLHASAFSISGGSVSVGGSITANGSVDIDANGGSYAGGNINITGGITNTAGNPTSLNAFGSGSFGGGNVTVGGNINLAGNLSVNASNPNPLGSTGGNINLADISANVVSLIAVGQTSNAGLGNMTVGNISAANNVFISANYGSSHVFGDISATHIDAEFKPAINGPINVTTGQLNVNGAAIGNRDILIDLVFNSDGGPLGSSAGTLTIDGATAQNGEAIFNVFSSLPPGTPHAGDFVANGAINAAGQVWVYAQNNITTADINAFRVTAFNGTGVPGDITMGNITASGTGSGSAGRVQVANSGDGFVWIQGGISATNIVTFDGRDSITIDGAVATTGGNVIFNVNNSVGAAVLTLNNDVQASGGVDFNLAGTGIETLILNGDVHANGGNIFFGSGIDAISYGAGLHEIKANGNIYIGGGAALIGSAGFVDYIAGSDFTYNNAGGNPGTFAARDITVGGIVNVNAVGNGLHIVRDITADHIDLHFTGANSIGGNSLDVSINSLTANGTGAGFHDVVLQVHDVAGGFASNASIAVGNIATAQGEVLITAFGGGDGADSATITTGNINTQRFLNIQTPGEITTGSITVSRTTGPVSVNLQAFRNSASFNGGDITVNGGITVSGRASTSNPNAAGVTLETLQAGGHAINVGGPISVTGTARAYSNASSNGNMGAVYLTARAADGSVSLGNITMNGVGEGWLEVQAADATLGNIGMNIANGSFTRTYAMSSTECMTTCSLTGQEQMFNGGRAEININNAAVPAADASATFGTVNVTAPNAHMAVSGFGSINGGGITMAATGADYAVSSTGTFEGQAINFSETHQGGGATVFLSGSSNGTVRLTGAVDLQARGNADLTIMSDTIKVRGVTVETSAGTFERSGQPAPMQFEDGPFSGGGMGAGPQINEGTFVGGGARVSLSGYSSGGTYGYTSAGLIEVNGAVAMTGAGNASLLARGNTVTVTGNITLDAGAAQQDGTFAREYTGSGGLTVQETGTVVSDWGNADVDIAASGNVTVANISITGPGAGGRLEGANIRAGAITINALGGELVIDETSTVGGVSEQVHFEGPNTFTGFALRADNTLELTGAFTLNAVGAGGAILSGTTIKTRDIAINVENGDYVVLEPDVFGAGTNTFTAGNALLGIQGATAQVTGNLTISAAQQAHFGGAATVSGNFEIEAGTGITRSIPVSVQFLNAVDSEDDDVTITLPSAFNIQADSIRLNSTSGTTRVAGATLNAANSLAINGGAVNATGANLRGGTVDLDASTGTLTMNNATVNTTGALAMAAATDILVSNVNLNAGTVRMTAGRDVSNSNPTGTITTQALAISAGRRINLANTALDIGNGSFADITGDSDFLRLLGAEDVVIPSSGPSLYIRGNDVALGNASVDGEYIFIEANRLQLTGTVTTRDPDLLLQIAPRIAGAAFGLEASTAASGAYLYDGTLNAFNAGTIALGTTSHSGNVAIGANGGIDIGDTHLFVLTRGNIRGLGLVTSTGIVKDLATLMNGEFDVPQTDEIDTRQDVVQTFNDDYALRNEGGRDEEEEGDEEGEDTDTDTDVEEEDDSLIRQDTVDEEMMCR